MKFSKKMAALGLVCVLALGQSVSATADIKDVFKVNTPSCTVLNGTYMMTGSCSASGHTYYVRNEVYGYKYSISGKPDWEAYGSGYNAASATAEGSSVKPYMVTNEGYYGSGPYSASSSMGKKVLYP